MLKHYFKSAWRSLKKNKAFSFINIFGLALGMAACLLILQYVSFELGYEDFQVNRDRIYRIEQDRYDNGKLSTQWAAGAYAIGSHIKNEVPEIEDYVKLHENGKVVTYVNNQPVKIEKVFFASGSFFNIFTYKLIAGDKANALQKPYIASVSETTAKKIFGTTDVVGKSLELNKNSTYLITAVYKDAPENTQIRPDILLSYATFVAMVTKNGDDSPDNAWYWDGCLTYVLLNKNANATTVEGKIRSVVQKYTDAELKKMNAGVAYHLQPLKDIHLTSHYISEPGSVVDGKTVYLLLGIALFIIVIAWVNYVNLSTARAIIRAKEVGVRKAIGSYRKQLIVQFLTESALLNMLALLISFLLMLIAIPAFNAISGQHLSFSLFANLDFWIGVLALIVVGTFAAGLYPAFILSGFNPIEVLKGRLGSAKQSTGLRKSLVTFQFVASLFLLIGTVIVFQQIQFMRKQSLGLNIDQTLVIQPPTVGIDSTFLTKMTTFKTELLRNTLIKNVAVSSNVPGDPVGWNAGGIKLLTADDNTQKQYRVIGVDYDYLNMYGIKLIAGRPFSQTFGTDAKSKAVIYTKKAVELLGFNKPEDAINKKIFFWGDTCTIVGVAADFHQQSLQQGYDDIILRLQPDMRGYISIKVNASEASNVLDYVKTKWNDYFAGNMFEYFFLDAHFDAQYKQDAQFGKVFMLFTCMAIFVSCLGLFGLASFTTLQRRKEIGIRKVLGASESAILKMLYKEIAFLLLIAFLIATPVAWLTTRKWLQGYAFKINMNWSFFIIPFLIIVLIATITISWQTIRAARANPVKSLKTE